jgi:hypothetical protein
MVFRLNPKGENVLIQTERHPVVGDLASGISNQFVAVAVNDYGVYAVLDRGARRIFVYSFFGEIIGIINYPPGIKGNFVAPTGITWFGDKLIATDRQIRRAYVFTMTEFGKQAMSSARYYHQGEWAKSAYHLEEALRLNSNYHLAYSGIGRHFLMQDDYENAMYFLRLGQNRSFFSRAFNHYRNLWVRDNFIWFVVVFLIVVVAVIRSEVKFHKKGASKNETGA